jgi:4-diphosphocytidyl-2-C-methyl-D-erythritol kinase
VATRTARVRPRAKINLGLSVLHRRPDGYHELRTVFHTLALGDVLDLAYTPGRGAEITLDDPLNLPGNLALEAAHLFYEEFGVAGRLHMRLAKRIPAGGGLGGGSSDAAAVLLALPALTGRDAPLGRLAGLAARLGSDVPFFLHGGAALGLGRGEELYPLPDYPGGPVLVVVPDLHVSTPEAYRALGRPADLTIGEMARKLNIFQSFVWQGYSASAMENDFEDAVFRLHPELGRLRRKLERLGARPARLSGSGAALFGVFPDRARLQGALPRFRSESLKVFSTTLLSRARYRAGWLESLGDHVRGRSWPPRSRYGR